MQVSSTRSHLTVAGLTFLLSLLSYSPLSAHDFGGTSSAGGGKPPPPDCDSKTMCCTDPGSSNPVSYLSGTERLSYSDLSVRGVYSIRITRRYDSQAQYDSPLGYGWAFDHDRRLFEYPDNSVIIRAGCGRRHQFLFTGGAYQTTSNSIQGDLVENPDGSFDFRYYNGKRDVYDAQGRLTLEENNKGQQHEFIYDSRGKLPLTGTSPFAVDTTTPMTVAYVYRVTRIQERGKNGVLTGYYVDLAYNETTGRLSTITASDGRVVTYTQDDFNGLTRGNLTQVVDAEGITQGFAYNDANDDHNVTSIQKRAGATAVINSYDSQDRVVQQNYGTHITVFDYVIDRGKTVITETISDDQGQNPYTTSQTYEFDALGNYTKRIDALGHETRHIFDANRDRIRTEIWQNTAGTLNLLQAKDFTYDGLGRKLTESTQLDSGASITTSWSYDQGWVASEQTVSSADPTKIFRTEFTFQRDANGIPTNIASSKRRRDDGSFQTTSYAYDAQGRLTTTTLPDGVQVINEYTGAYLTKTYFKDAGGTALANNQRTFAYDSRGNRIKSWDARNNLSQFSYDDRGRILTQTNALNQQTRYTYTDNNLTQIETGYTVAEGEGQLTQFIYDGKDRRIEIKRKDDGGTFQTYQTFAYDSRNQLLTQTDALGRSTNYSYDLQGRMVQITDPAGKITQFAYDALTNRTQMTDALSRSTNYVFDDLNRLTKEEQLGITPSATTQYAYDAVGNLTSVTDPETNITQYTYDALSRRTQETRPLGQALKYFYDNRDRIDHILNARNQRINYSYADWGAVNNEQHYLDAGATNLSRSISYSYDLDGNPTSSNDDSIQAADLYTTSYDELSRPATQTIKYIPGGDKILTTDYDRFGNRNSLLLNDGELKTHSYSYDKRNRLTQATLPGTQAFTISYTEADERSQINYPNGVTTAYTYASNGPIKTIDTKTSASAILESWTYNYNAVLNIDDITTSNGQTDYTYDGLNRLTTADYPLASPLTNESYQYDKVGNREDPTDPLAYDYDQNNRILQSPINTTTSYSFDDDGNLTQSTTASTTSNYSYDIINRLRTYTGPSNTAIYTYDPNGRRINKTVNGANTTWFLWDGTQIMAEYDGAGVRKQRYAYLPNDFAPTQSEDANGIYNIHADHLQTPKLLTDSTQNIVWINQMRAFGESAINNDPDGNGTTVAMNIRFPGQYEDQESGLYQNYFRDYDPAIGRYVESDPIGLGGGINFYTYGKSSPALYVDYYGLEVTGHWTVTPFITVTDVDFTGFGKGSAEDRILFRLYYDVTGSGFAQIGCSEDCPDSRSWSLTLDLNERMVPVQLWIMLPKNPPFFCSKLPPAQRRACEAAKWAKRLASLAGLIQKGKHLATEEGREALMTVWNIGMSAPDFPTVMCENFSETTRLEF